MRVKGHTIIRGRQRNISNFISEVLAGEVVGITEVEEKMWKVKFMDLVLGHYDENEGKFSPMREMILEKV